MIDVNQLRQLTKSAQEKAAQAAKAVEAQLLAEQQHQREMDELFAQRVIGQILRKCTAEAGEGRNHAIVMSLKYDRDYHTTFTTTLISEQLRGPAKIVYDYCVTNNLRPTLEYWHDGVGMHSGYNLVVHWGNDD